MTARGLAELEYVERAFRALAHAMRRHVLVVLNARGGRMTAGQIAERFSCSWPTTSRHLRVLEEARLVRVEAQGRERVYFLERDRLNAVVGGWMSWFNKHERKQR